MKAPIYSSFGAAASGVLNGGKEGTYQFNNKVVFNAKADGGVEAGVTGLMKADNKVDIDVRLGKKFAGIPVETVISSTGAAVATASITELGIPGLKAVTSVAYPDTLDKFKVTLDYAVPHVTSRVAIANLNNTKVDASVSVGLNSNFSLGADASYDVVKANLAKWSAGALYTQGSVSAVGTLVNGSSIKAQLAFQPYKDSSLAAEIVHKLGGDTTFAVGGSRKIESGLYKARLDSNGTLSLLYGTQINNFVKAEASVAFDTVDFGKNAKTGVSFEVSYH